MAKNIVYFLGAGCSKNFGYMLTSEIMPAIVRNLEKDNLFLIDENEKRVEKQKEELLRQYLMMIYPGLAERKKLGNLPNIIEVLSFVEHCCIYNVPPHPRLSDERLIEFRELLNRAVGEVMLDDEVLHFTRQEQSILDRFVKSVGVDSEDNITIITTNYDLSIDLALYDHMVNREVDYGIPYRDTHKSYVVPVPEKPLLRFYKLHGSLNWTRCDLCGYYYINPEGSTVHQTYVDTLSSANTCICSKQLRLKSVLVAPSLVRDIRDPNLLQIWKSSMEALRTADKIVFIGYSLPSEDFAIKSIILRGLNGRHVSQKLQVDVVQFKNNQAEQNYRNLFGNRMKYYNLGLKDYLNSQSMQVRK